MIKKGDWIEIVQEVLAPEDRSSAIPEETKATPLKMWVKGYASKDCEIGEEVEITSVNGRTFTGIATQLRPAYTHDFGEFVEEILYIGPQAKKILWGEN